MRAICVFALSVLLPIGLLSCGPGQETTGPTADTTGEPLQQPDRANDLAAAEWSGGTIYLSDIDNIVRPEQMMATYRLQEDVRWEDVIAQKRESMVNMLLDNYLLIEEANTRGLSLSDADKEALLREFKGQFETEAEYQKHIAEAQQTEEQLVRILSNIQLGRLCMEDQKRSVRESLTPEVLQEYYKTQIDKFTPPARSEVNRVVIEAKDGQALEQAKEKALDLHAQVQALIAAATDFAGKRKVIQQYAYQYSDTPDGSYNYGYCIIYHTEGIEKAYGEEFVAEVLQTPEGELSPVVPAVNGYGFFLVKVKQSAGVQPFEAPQVQAILPQMLMQEKLEAWRESLRQKYQVKIKKDVLREQLPDPANVTPAPVMALPTPVLGVLKSSAAENRLPIRKAPQ